MVTNFEFRTLNSMNHATRLLLGCLGYDEPAAIDARLRTLAGRQWEGLVQAALDYNLAPQLHHRIKLFSSAGSAPPEMRQRLKAAYYLAVTRNMRLYRDLQAILRTCTAAGVPVMLLKGAHLAEIVYGNIALRPMGDIDLLVKPADLLAVHGLLVEQGYVNAEKDRGNALGHLPPYCKKNSPPVEIHYTICSPPFSGRFAVEELWDRAWPAEVQGARALTLCPEDLLLHLCVHAAIDHGFEIGPLPFLDIARTIEKYGSDIDWVSLLHRARQWGLGRCLHLMLCLSNKMLGLPLPEQLRSGAMQDCLDEREVAAAEELVFERGTPVASDVARLFGKESLSAKLRYCLRQIFPSGEAMRTVHPRTRNRLALLGQYFFRSMGLFQRQGKIAWRLLLRDKEMLECLRIENRRNQVKDWIIDQPNRS